MFGIHPVNRSVSMRRKRLLSPATLAYHLSTDLERLGAHRVRVNQLQQASRNLLIVLVLNRCQQRFAAGPEAQAADSVRRSIHEEAGRLEPFAHTVGWADSELVISHHVVQPPGFATGDAHTRHSGSSRDLGGRSEQRSTAARGSPYIGRGGTTTSCSRRSAEYGAVANPEVEPSATSWARSAPRRRTFGGTREPTGTHARCPTAQPRVAPANATASNRSVAQIVVALMDCSQRRQCSALWRGSCNGIRPSACGTHQLQRWRDSTADRLAGAPPAQAEPSHRSPRY